MRWKTPEPLPGLPPAPKWDDDLLPEVLRPRCADIAHRMQCPPEYVAVAMITGLGSVIGRSCAIRPKERDDWTVVANMYGAAVGRPSAMKSPAVMEALKPIRNLEWLSAEEYHLAESEREVARAELGQVKRAMGKSKSPSDLRDDFDLCREKLAELEKRKRYLVQDATVEKLGEILNENPKGVLLYRDELIGFLKQLDKAGRENDRSFYLESWNGTGSYIYDRVGRGTIAIEAACVSIFGTIQPGPLQDYLRGAVEGHRDDDGLIQRFQLIVYPEPRKHWENIDRYPDKEANRTVRELFERLATATAHDFRAETDSSDARSLPYIRFDDSGQKRFNKWRANLENRLLKGDEHPALEAHLTKYRSLFPSLALIFQIVDHPHGPVGDEAANRAERWCGFLEGHARRVFASAIGGDTYSARLLLKKIQAGALPDPFQAHQVYKKHWSGLTSKNTQAAIDCLDDFGWVRQVIVPTDGRKRTDVYVNPVAKGES